MKQKRSVPNMKRRSNTVFGGVPALFGESFDAIPQLLKPLPKSLLPFLVFS
jgi:hypothetical protein